MVNRMMRTSCATFFAAGLYCTVAIAQSTTALPDPTRPPTGVQAGGEQSLGDNVAGPVLQSVIVPKKGKPSALISGQVVTLGGRVGDSRLIGLTEKEAVLEGPGGVEHLLLTPNVEKKNIVLKTTAARSAQSKGKP